MKKTTIFLLLSACIVSAAEGTYVNPVDGSQYQADWKSYVPMDGTADQSSRIVEIKSTRLLSTQKEFGENVSVAELADFIKGPQNNIEGSIDLTTEGFELLVDTVLSNAEDPEFTIASQGAATKEQLQKIHDGLKKMTGFRSKSADLKYQVHYIIKKKG